MKSQNEDQKLTETRTKAKKPRFKIEKLEERIAPNRPLITGVPGGHGHAPFGTGPNCSPQRPCPF
jgi:hypothetical protein